MNRNGILVKEHTCNSVRLNRNNYKPLDQSIRFLRNSRFFVEKLTNRSVREINASEKGRDIIYRPGEEQSYGYVTNSTPDKPYLSTPIRILGLNPSFQTHCLLDNFGAD